MVKQIDSALIFKRAFAKFNEWKLYRLTLNPNSHFNLISELRKVREFFLEELFIAYPEINSIDAERLTNIRRSTIRETLDYRGYRSFNEWRSKYALPQSKIDFDTRLFQFKKELRQN